MDISSWALLLQALEVFLDVVDDVCLSFKPFEVLLLLGSAG